jgi:hypothetical protein
MKFYQLTAHLGILPIVVLLLMAGFGKTKIMR